MSKDIRGKIYNQRRARQLKDFSGLRYGNITPMDIDGIIEFKNKLFVFIEYKSFGSELGYGQRLCLSRLVAAINKGGIACVAIVADHAPNICDEIDGAKAVVREYFYLGKWSIPEFETTTKAVVDWMHNKYVKD